MQIPNNQRRFWKIHLSTALLMVFGASGLMWANLRFVPGDRTHVISSSWTMPAITWTWPPKIGPDYSSEQITTERGNLYTRGWPAVVMERVIEVPELLKDRWLDITIEEATEMGLSVRTENDKIAFEGVRRSDGAYVNFECQQNSEPNRVHFLRGETHYWKYRGILLNVVVCLSLVALLGIVSEHLIRFRPARVSVPLEP